MTPPSSNGSAATSPAPILSPLDVDMDDSDMDMMHSPLSPTQARPSRPFRLNPQSLAHNPSGGRLPTPIHSSFLPTSRRVSVPVRDGLGITDAGSFFGGSFHHPAKARIPSCPSVLPTSMEHSLPSPISENGPETPTTAAAGNQLSQLSMIGEEGMELDMAETSVAVRLPLSQPGGIPSPVHEGTGSKRRFSMGYREDCSRCRERVPGHFSHFIPA